MTIFMLIYFAGIMSCGMQGAEKMIQTSKRIDLNMCSALLNSFGGGFLRDVFLLSVFPVVFTPECVPDIVVAIIAATVYLKIQQYYLVYSTLTWITVIADAAGLGTFIAIGVDKAIDSGREPFMAILSGIITSQGGGVLAAIFSGRSLQRVLSTNIAYRLMAVGGVLLYSWFSCSTADPISSQYMVILYTTVGALACNNLITEKISKRMHLVIDSKFLCTAMIQRSTHFVLVPYYKRDYWNLREVEAVISRLTRVPRKRTLLYHCMKLM